MERLRGAGAAILCFATVTATLLSWSSFTIDDRHYLVPAVVIGGLVLVTGVICRGLRMHGAVVALAQLAVGMLATSTFLSGSPIPLTAAARGRLSEAFAECGDVVSRVFPPMPVQHGIAPLLIPGALLAYWLADLLACTLRRPSLAGLVFLGVFTVPFSVVGGGVKWSVFVLAAATFLGLLVVQESDRVGRWGRRLGDDTPGAITGAGDQSRASAPLLIGAAATALAVAAPSFVPTTTIDFSSWGAGGSRSHQPITVSNPMVGMYGSLKQQTDVPLVQVQITGGAPQPPPEYLRVAVLTKFDGTQWSTGDRSIPTDHTAHQSIQAPDGVPLGATTSYSITTLPQFNSSWLPTFDFTTRIDALGDWRFDTDTYDFIAADPSLTTAGLTYADTAAPVEPTKDTLEHVPFGTTGVPAAYTELPAGFPGQVTQLAVSVTENQPTPFLQAVALQDWFSKTGGFRYSLSRAGGDGNDDLLHFVTNNKVGYCQQFATAMAAMARAIGIPARVDVGFLHAVPVPGRGEYLFSGKDMHAWPELWFKGVGWVRFEPTPGVGATIPTYTQGVKLAGALVRNSPGEGVPSKGPGAKKGAKGHNRQPDIAPNTTTPQTPAPTGHERSWAWVWTCLGLLIAGALLGAPYWIRRRRRHRRLAGGVEDAWSELHDTVRDLGLPWAVGASPRDQASRLRQYVGDGDAGEALWRLVLAVERTRYARTPGSSAAGRDAAHVIAAIEEWADPSVRRRARTLPRSLFSTDLARRQASAERESERRLVDRVG